MRPLRPLRSLRALAALAGLAALAVAQTCPEPGAVAFPPGDDVVGQAGGVQEFPASAAGGGVHLVAWSDHRSSFSTLYAGEGTRDVYAMRVGSDGAPLDPTSFRVAGGLGRKENVRVAWNGAHFLVTWSQDSPTTFSKAVEVLGVRVTPSGQVVDDPPISIKKFAWSSSVAHGLGSNGDGWHVVTQGSSAGEASLEARFVAADGSVGVASASLFPISHLILDLELTFDGAVYLFTWLDGITTYGRRYTPAFGPLGGTFTVAPGGGASVTTDGDGFFATWVEGGIGAQIQARHVGSSGSLGPVVAVTPLSVHEYHFDPDVAWNGSGFTVAFSSGQLPPTTVTVAELAADGSVLHLETIGQGLETRNATVSSLGDGGAFVAYADVASTPPHDGDVFGLPTGGALGQAVALSSGRPRQGAPDLAAGGEGYLSVFTSERDGAVAILAQRLDRAGGALDAEPIELASGPALGAPRAAWNGESFLVVWHDLVSLGLSSFATDDLVLGRRLGPDGTLLDAAPFQVMDGATPDVAAADGAFLVAARRADTTELYRIYGLRLDGEAQPLDGAPMLVGGNFARHPAVESFGDAWVVAWQRNPTHDDPFVHSMARVVDADGSMASSVSLGAGGLPGAAASPEVALVTWGGGDVRGQLVSKGGAAVGGELTISGGPEAERDPAVAWNGFEFVVVWEDFRDVDAYFDDRRDLYTARLAEDGSLLDGPGGCPLATSPDDEQLPTVAGRDGGHLFGHAAFLPDAPEAAVRVALTPGSPWTALGGGVAGAAGMPGLTGGGILAAGGSLELGVSAAAPSSTAVHVIGVTTLDVPFNGGTLVPYPHVMLVAATDASGAATTQLPVPASFPAGAQLWAQTWILDAGAPYGYAGTSALTQVAQ